MDIVADSPFLDTVSLETLKKLDWFWIHAPFNREEDWLCILLDNDDGMKCLSLSTNSVVFFDRQVQVAVVSRAYIETDI